ncbi:MAG: hypothetical protein AAF317_07485, partial [Pseudomonadota bacterium]
MAIFWRDKLFLAAIESTYGNEEVPAGAGAILAKEIRITPMEGKDIDRELELPYFGSQGTVPSELHAKVSFKIEVAPSGAAGTPPAWGPMLRGCGIAETISAGTSVTYNPITNDPESLTFHFVNGGTRYTMIGSRGTANIEFVAQDIPYWMLDFTGLFVL